MPGGTNGGVRPAPALAYFAVAGFVLLVDAVNILTLLHDAARHGQTLAPWEPTTWELSSGAAEISVCWIIDLALRRAPPGRGPWAPTLAVHFAASLAFSALHVGLMLLLRIGVYGLLGLSYRFDLADLPYEYRKDLLAYLVLGGVFYLFSRQAPVEAPPLTPETGTFDIIDGERRLRVPVATIIAVRSAGNYVEFQLEDGRRPLMRATLSAIERSLSPLGFERTHRSWLVNLAQIRGLTPVGSGDYRVDLAAEVQAPLSRRFPDALARLRRGAEAMKT